MDDGIIRRYAVIEKFGDYCYNLIAVGSEDEIDDCMPIIHSLCSGIGEARKVDISNIDPKTLSKSDSKLKSLFDSAI